MFQITEVIKRLFKDPTPEEEDEREWNDVNQLLTFPAIYPNFDAERACMIIKEDYPNIWFQHTDEIKRKAKESEQSYYEED